jgi:hypothetical protein
MPGCPGSTRLVPVGSRGTERRDPENDYGLRARRDKEALQADH